MQKREQVAGEAEPFPFLIMSMSAAPAEPPTSVLCDIIVRWETVRELLPLYFKGHDGIFI